MLNSRVFFLREKINRLTPMLSERSIKVTQRGTEAYVSADPVTGVPFEVNIPYIPDDASEELMVAIEGFLDHEVGHVLETNFHVARVANSMGAGQIFNVIEDTRVERRMMARFPGSARNLQGVAEFFCNKKRKTLDEGCADPMGELLPCAFRAWAGQTVFADFMHDKWHLVEPVGSMIGDYAKRTLPYLKTSEDVLEAAAEIKRILDTPPPEEDQDEPNDEGDDAEDKSDKDGEKSPGGTPDDDGEPSESDPSDGDDESDKDDSGDTDGKGEGEGKSESSDGDDTDSDAGSDMDEENIRDEPDSDGKVDETGGGSGSELTDSPKPSDVFESMKDFSKEISEELGDAATVALASASYRVWTTDLDVVEEAPLAPASAVTEMQDAVDHMIGPMQKGLERAIASRALKSWSYGHRSGRLNCGSLARLVAFNDDRVFRRREEKQGLDVAVTLLVDCSGSMRHNRRICTAGLAAYGLASVLERIRVPCEVLGFTADGRGMDGGLLAKMARGEGFVYSRVLPLHHLIFKAFAERLNVESKRRIASMVDMPTAMTYLYENVDGESVAWAGSRLSMRKEKRKILIVLSDGEPCCPGDRSAQEVNLIESINLIERAGIEVLGIGINTDCVKRFYKRNLVLHELNKLPELVMKQISAALISD